KSPNLSRLSRDVGERHPFCYLHQSEKSLTGMSSPDPIAVPAGRWILPLVLLTALLPACCRAENSAMCATPASGWESTYLSDIGMCVYTQDFATRARFGFADSQANCAAATSTTGLAKLAEPHTEQKQIQLLNAMLKKSLGYLRIWTGASCDVASSRFVWSTGSPVTPLVACSSATARLYFSGEPTTDYSSFVSSFVGTTNLSLTYVQLCEYGAPQCDPFTVSSYNNATMRLSATAYANRTVRFNCAPGFYRPSEIVLVGGAVDKTATASNNLFHCNFVPGGTDGRGTASFVQVGSMLPLEQCQPSSCQGWVLLNQTIIQDVEDYKSGVEANRNYNFGEVIPLQCKRGYVSVTDEMSTSAQLVCGQSDLNPSLGMWTPATLVVCTAIRCKGVMPFYDFTKMTAYKAFNRLKDRSFTSDESNRFPYYPNEVSLRCRHEGKFFMDRTYDKALKCDLPNNGTNTTAVWFPFGGTVLSKDIMDCKPITCLTKEIVLLTQQEHVLVYLLQSNLNETLIITNPDDTVATTTVLDFATTTEFDYGARVRFTCQSGYQMNAPGEGGHAKLVNSTEVSCISTGTWSFRISSCIKQTEALQLTGGGVRYVPPAQEAAGAQSLGVVVIIILIAFFGTILILDLATIARDVKLLRTNLKRIKLKVQLKKAK
ncbi:hypothetical protein BOX15_Mlig031258g3, partial [Macrostomum lignano]